MYKVLYVGDPHARPDSLDEMQSLVDYICKVAIDTGVDSIFLLGDLFHTHSVINLAVLAFWDRAFKQMRGTSTHVWALVGNHDMSGRDNDPSHALMLYRSDTDGLSIIDELTRLPWGAVALPYMANREKMVEIANLEKSWGRLLICHQTFLGSTYENGFYAHDGVDQDLFDYDFIISGHIHTPQTIGKVWYPGSPRWQIVTDANTERNIWVVEHDLDGSIISATPYATDKVCKPIWLFKDTEEEPVDISGRAGTIMVDVHGSEAYVKTRKAVLEAQGVRVRPFPESARRVIVRESEGVATAFRKYTQTFKAKNSTPSDRLLELACQRVSWLRGEA